MCVLNWTEQKNWAKIKWLDYKNRKVEKIMNLISMLKHIGGVYIRCYKLGKNRLG